MKRALMIAGGALVVALAAATGMTRGAARSEPARHPPVVVFADHMLEPVVVRPAPRKPPRPPRTAVTRALDGEAIPVEITAYCLSGTTRRGRWVRPGIVAADPRVFPLSRYIELFVGDDYLGKFLVDDTGSAIKGQHIDLWVPTCREAVHFGRVQGTAVLVPRKRKR
ncbi:MAG: 3D domain-containing protein [Gemmatimonadaceae bacterium]|nr:3D domain-containing protein [Gemmatimonadaceae bacterium]NUQ91776.1 3D domain-containing protein [Gemmatimonadaceae bacterium]NUS98805.1 3D domain-containing protein [Gemmatimonadaceae bacterium]